MIDFSETQLLIMEALARYKFLTSGQMVKLGIAANRHSIYRAIRTLPASRIPWVDKKNFPPVPGIGKVESVYFLREKSVQMLEENLGYEADSIRFPKSKQSFFSRDYAHRIGTVDFQICWNRFSENNGLTLFKFLTYFDFSGSNRNNTGEALQSLTRIPVQGHGRGFIVPDAVVHFRQPDKRERLFLFELANGRDAGYIMKQIYGHARAIAQGTPQQAFSSEVGARLLYAFELKSTMTSVLSRFAEDPNLKKQSEWFLFAHFPILEDNFENAWHFCDHRIAPLT